MHGNPRLVLLATVRRTWRTTIDSPGYCLPFTADMLPDGAAVRILLEGDYVPANLTAEIEALVDAGISVQVESSDPRMLQQALHSDPFAGDPLHAIA